MNVIDENNDRNRKTLRYLKKSAEVKKKLRP
jgi:hypothetical protein